ncbi:MAG: hypothetical protein J3K34DRAFT_462267 [Monoraphidium minutum]|nr:MAG: hypothetical protein J3K34DRAFT_462267 [Monoraphidium minutum]
MNEVKGTWKPEEDEALRKAVERAGDKNWMAVSRELNMALGYAGSGRTAKQCRGRYMHHLKPGLKRGPWTWAEEEALVASHRQLGNSWSKIAKHLPGRTETDLKNHWNCTLRKKMPWEEAQRTPLQRYQLASGFSVGRAALASPSGGGPQPPDDDDDAGGAASGGDGSGGGPLPPGFMYPPDILIAAQDAAAELLETEEGAGLAPDAAAEALAARGHPYDVAFTAVLVQLSHVAQQAAADAATAAAAAADAEAAAPGQGAQPPGGSGGGGGGGSSGEAEAEGEAPDVDEGGGGGSQAVGDAGNAAIAAAAALTGLASPHARPPPPRLALQLPQLPPHEGQQQAATAMLAASPAVLPASAAAATPAAAAAAAAGAAASATGHGAVGLSVSGSPAAAAAAAAAAVARGLGSGGTGGGSAGAVLPLLLALAGPGPAPSVLRAVAAEMLALAGGAEAAGSGAAAADVAVGHLRGALGVLPAAPALAPGASPLAAELPGLPHQPGLKQWREPAAEAARERADCAPRKRRVEGAPAGEVGVAAAQPAKRAAVQRGPYVWGGDDQAAAAAAEGGGGMAAVEERPALVRPPAGAAPLAAAAAARGAAPQPQAGLKQAEVRAAMMAALAGGDDSDSDDDGADADAGGGGSGSGGVAGGRLWAARAGQRGTTRKSHPEGHMEAQPQLPRGLEHAAWISHEAPSTSGRGPAAAGRAGGRSPGIPWATVGRLAKLGAAGVANVRNLLLDAVDTVLGIEYEDDDEEDVLPTVLEYDQDGSGEEDCDGGGDASSAGSGWSAASSGRSASVSFPLHAARPATPPGAARAGSALMGALPLAGRAALRSFSALLPRPDDFAGAGGLPTTAQEAGRMAAQRTTHAQIMEAGALTGYL